MRGAKASEIASRVLFARMFAATQRLPLRIVGECVPIPSTYRYPAVKTGGNVKTREDTKRSSMACCQAASAEKDVATFEAEEQRGVVQEYYGKELQGTEDLKTSACCTAKPPSGQVRSILAKVPDEVMSKYYGCGSVRRWYGHR